MSFTQSADVNGDGVIDANDISPIIECMGAVKGTANYNSALDIDGNGIIEWHDVQLVRAQSSFRLCECAPA